MPSVHSEDATSDDEDDSGNSRGSRNTPFDDDSPDPGPASESREAINWRLTHGRWLMLSRILRCPVCHLPFNSPTTLHCGHTVCSNHSTHPCPVPQCSPASASPDPVIPASSSVTFFAAQDPEPPVQLNLASRFDVTLTKLISLISRFDAQLDPSDEDNDLSESSSRVRPRSPSSPSSPRIRKRRRYSLPQDDQEDDLLAHLRKQSVVQKSTPHDEPLLPSHSPSTRHDILSTFEKDLLAELNCDICCTLFYQPVTTPCQHTFCSKCLHRSLDHSTSCPICRQTLPGYSYFQDHPENKVLLALILKAFPAMYKERGDVIEAEEREARLDTPVFVCQLCFPGMPTLLHFFEPRYRLMLRRCLESPNPRFGMVMAPKPGATSPHEYGTMLEIRRVQMLHDGRSVVETWGTFRFRLLESGTKDGYMVGRIERIDDYPEDIVDTIQSGEGQNSVPPPEVTPAVASSSSATASSSTTTSSAAASTSSTSTTSNSDFPLASSSSTTASTSSSMPLPADSDSDSPQSPPEPTNAELMERCRTFLDRLQRGTAPWVVQRLRSTYGTYPTDPSSFSFWVAYVIPIEEQEKAKLLPIRSPRLRLLLVTHWIEQLDNNWYKGRILIHWLILLILAFVSFFALRSVMGVV